jgi:hypothetical protein
MWWVLAAVRGSVRSGAQRRSAKARLAVAAPCPSDEDTKQLHTPPLSSAHCRRVSMSSPLVDVWEAAAASPFQPSVGKDSQFALGFALLFACTSPVALCHAPDANVHANANPPASPALDGLLRSEYVQPPRPRPHPHLTPTSTSPARPAHAHTDRSLANLPLVGAPASVAFGYVAAPAAPQPSADAAQLRCRVHDLRSRRLRLGFPCLLAPAFVACCLFSLRECNKLDPPPPPPPHPHPASASVSTLLTL